MISSGISRLMLSLAARRVMDKLAWVVGCSLAWPPEREGATALLNVVGVLAMLLCFTPTDIDLIVLTHLHPDHTAGVDFLRRTCTLPVAASVVARQFATAEAQSSRVLPGISHLAGQVLPGTLHHLDLFPPHYASQMKMIDLCNN